MAGGTYNDLKLLVEQLKNHLTKLSVDNKSNKNKTATSQPNTATSTDSSILEKFDKQLAEVIKLRDTYNTKWCANCEHLREDLVSLKSLQDKKGSKSEKPERCIDLLYQHTTSMKISKNFLITRSFVNTVQTSSELTKRLPGQFSTISTWCQHHLVWKSLIFLKNA
jgi:hypothetical protein